MTIPLNNGRARLPIALISLAFLAAGWTADAQVGKSLNNCQKTVGKTTGKYIRTLGTTIGKCLQSASRKVLTDDGSAADASKLCISQMAKLEISADPARSLGGKFEAKLDRACDPAANDSIWHLEADIFEIGATTISAANLGAFCENYGGDGSIDSFTEWRSCLREAAECQAYQAVAVQYPRALEYLEVLAAEIESEASSTMELDALAAIRALEDAIEGTTDDNLPDIFCGTPEPCDGTCGNGIAENGETCDGGDLNGGTCAAFGFFGGYIACVNCAFDTLGCTGAGLPATGQTTSSGAASDGAIRAGTRLTYNDNGDGTVSDLTTGLMWEKKDDSGGLHDKDNRYSWCANGSYPGQLTCDLPQNDLDGTVVTAFLGTLNDYASGGANCFAQHCDWRLPNYKELVSILDLERNNPALDPVFHNSNTCTGCTDVTAATCTCSGFGQTVHYWTSTTLPGSDYVAFVVEFAEGGLAQLAKGDRLMVRAVRGGI